jgi:hypothetical protein
MLPARPGESQDVKAFDPRDVAAYLAVGGSAVFGVAALVEAIVWRTHAVDVASGLIAALFLPVALVGAAAVRARSGGVLGWILLAAGVCLPLATSAYIWAAAAFQRGLPGAFWAGWLDGWPWIPGVALIPTVGMLLFPTGRLPSPRWRPVLVIDLLVLAALTIWTTLGTELIDFPGRANPLAGPGVVGLLADAFVPAIALVAPLSTLSAVAITRRYRAQRGTAAGSALRLVFPAAWACTAAWWSCIVIVTVGGDGATPRSPPSSCSSI